MSYHVSDIPNGVFGQFSKIREEFLEAEDAYAQHNPLMVLQELSDLLGAIDAYAHKFNMDIAALMKMTNATTRAFESGHRKPKSLDLIRCCKN